MMFGSVVDERDCDKTSLCLCISCFYGFHTWLKDAINLVFGYVVSLIEIYIVSVFACHVHGSFLCSCFIMEQLQKNSVLHMTLDKATLFLGIFYVSCMEEFTHLIT
jgi:hypothetical protein